MIRDEVQEAISLLNLGIARNVENPPLNRDMQMMIEKLSQLTSQPVAEPEDEKSTSAVQMLLRQYGDKDTKH